jgi:hypothetical protein
LKNNVISDIFIRSANIQKSSGLWEIMGETYDRLNQSRHGLRIITVITIIAAIMLVASAGSDRRDALDMTARLINMLNLSAPALFPSGHGLRDSGYAHPAIDLRHGPYLPPEAVSPYEILSGNPAANRRNIR